MPTSSARACPREGGGCPRRAVRTQAQPGHRPQRLDPRCRRRGRQPRRRRALPAHARAPDRPLRRAAAAGRRHGGYASRDNLTAAKARDVKDVAFHKKRGLAVEDMVKSRWVYRKLRNFRAGIEAGISCLKRAYGLARCTWRGLDHFKTYIWSAVVAHNLVLFARFKLV